MTNIQSTEEHHSSEMGEELPIKRIIISSTIGAVLEWFDFFIFASLSGLILGRLFFSPSDPVAEVLLGFSTLAVGYFARPIGGIIFGHFGDRLGRKKMLMVTIWLMGLSTVLMGILPTYDVMGVSSTIALVVLRLLQGIAVGGEYGGAALLIIEHAARSRRRGFYSAWANVGASFGFLLSSALLAVITGMTTDEQFQEWAWRIPFMVSAVLLFVGAYIRKRIYETPALENLKKAGDSNAPAIRKIPLFALFQSQWKQLLSAFAVPICTLTFYQIGLVFVTPYATRYAGYDPSLVLAAISIAQVVYIVASLSWARLSDKIGRRPVIAVGAIGCAGWIFAFFPLIHSGNFISLVVAVAGLLVFVGATWGPQAAFLAELFTADVRYSGLSVGYQTAGAVAGLIPLLTFAALTAFGSWVPITIVSLAGALIGLVGIGMAKETALEDLRV